MKIVHATIAEFNVTVPVNEGYRVQFTDHRAVVPDAVADYLAAVGPSVYQIVGTFCGESVRGGSVLVVRDMGLGDVLLATPLIRRLATDYQATVDVLTFQRYRCLLDHNPSVRATYALEGTLPDYSQYDILLDLRLVVENAEAQGRYRHRADAFAQLGDFTLTQAERRPDYFLQEAERSGYAFLQGDTPLIGYVLRSSTRNRNWSTAKHQAVLLALFAAGYRVAVLDQEYHEFGHSPGLINLSGQIPLRHVAAAMAACDVIVTPDTGLFHLAAALDKPTVTYFGAMPVEERASHRALTTLTMAANCALLPCRKYYCLNTDAEGMSRCLDISPESVVDAIRTHLSAKEPISCASEATDKTETRSGSRGRASRKP